MFAIHCGKVAKDYLQTTKDNDKVYQDQDKDENGTYGSVVCRLQNEMMTSVTLPSSSGPIHGGFSSGVANEPTDSERDFETPRPVKRCLTTSLADSCKKRRKQATPVRISAADSPPEGKPPIPSPEPELHCPVCQLVFNDPDQLQSHLSTEHVNVECKREPADSPAPPTSDNPESPVGIDPMAKQELSSWIPELPNKEWISPNLLSFPTANHMFMGLPPFTQPDTMPPRQPIRIFNPDAYCELCNKEFCNKYFLKTHKANKHGIYTDPPPVCENSSNSMTAVSIPSYVGNMKIPTSLPPNLDLATVKIEPKSYPDMYANPFANKLFNKVSKASNILFENNENQENTSTTTSNGIPNEESGPDQSVEESSSPKVIQNETTSTSLKQELTSDQELFYTSPSKMSPGQQSRELDLSNRYRRLGVMNPKAFCEICCKEYCNKYFLRTHKMKRHGIFIPDDRDKDMKMEFMGMPYTQTSPLNLIMGEQSNSSDRKTSSPSDISCELCGIKFQNMSLFQLHNVSMHAKLPTIDTTPNNSDDKKTNDCPEKSGASSADSISEDLQKLQTMILQLNDLDESKANSTCSTCNKEFDNRYYLHAHMMTEHGLLLDDNADVEKSTEADANINNNTMCDLCGKDFPNYDDMKKHIYEAHKPTQTPTTPSEVKDEFNNGFTTPEKTARNPIVSGQVNERRSSMNLTPTSSYCEICNKELCNKYFMKTHMQRMHGIEIENGAQIGGVVCDICNKELCSKYFLRVHKHNTHGIVEYGSNLLQPRKFEDPPPAPLPAVEPDPALKPADLADLSHRYFTHFTEVCTLCSRRFRSTKWLKAHLLSDHGQAGAEKWAEVELQLQLTMGQQNKSALAITPLTKTSTERVSPTIKVPNSTADAISVQQQQQQQKMGLQNVLSSIFGADESTAKTYHCSYCPFSTPVLPFLFVHERSHTIQSTDSENLQLKCPVCMQTFTQADQLQHHIFSQHPFLPLPPFFNGYNGNESQGEVSKEPSECADDIDDGASSSDQLKQPPSQQQQQLHQQQQPQTSGSGTGTATASTSNKTSKKVVSAKRKPTLMPPEMDETLKEVAKKSQLPATYALPQIAGASGQAGGGSGANASLTEDDETPPSANHPSYVMQAFLVEEQQQQTTPLATATATANAEHKVMPSIVFLPVLQKLSAPITATFTLTPA